MTDEELLKKTLEARRAAHDAPLAEVYAENQYGRPTGKLKIRDHTRAYADRANEWMALAKEVDRRGLKQPIPDWDGDSRR